jgi:hypothetical protein
MRADGEQLKTLAALYDAGALRPVIDRTFPFDQTLDAMASVEQGCAKGKIVVVMPRPRTWRQTVAVQRPRGAPLEVECRKCC